MQLIDAKQFEFCTENLHIRPLVKDDKELYKQLYTDNRVMRFICAPLTDTQAELSFKNALKYNQSSDTDRLFLVSRLESCSEGLALCCISNLDRVNRTAEIGNMVLPKAQGKRIAQEATVALMYRIKEVLGISHFTMDIHEQNIPAQRAARLLGFEQCKTNLKLYTYHLKSRD